jgi:integrase
MASIYKPAGSKRYVINYRDEHGRLRKKTAYTDKRESERLAGNLEETARKVRDGLTSRGEISVVARQKQAIDDHVNAYHKNLLDSDFTRKHADLARRRLIRLFGIAGVATLREINAVVIQSALARLRTEGRGLKTLNHYGDTAKMFVAWCIDDGRMATNPLATLKRYKADKDVRHERRSISIEEFNRLLEAARSGEKYGRMTGPLRELCYRFAFTTGLRFGEIKALKPDWFDWQTLKITIPAKIAKNRKTTTLPIDERLAEDLKARIAAVGPGEPVFPMPKRGYAMIQVDLESAQIPYKLDGKFFDFHAVRGMTATILDEIGAPSGVRRELMRHSTDSMTALYTRPREDQRREAVERLASVIGPADGATESATEEDDDDEPDDTNPNGLSDSAGSPDLITRVQFPPLVSSRCRRTDILRLSQAKVSCPLRARRVNASTDRHPATRRFGLGDSLILIVALAIALGSMHSTYWLDRIAQRTDFWRRAISELTGRAPRMRLLTRFPRRDLERLVISQMLDESLVQCLGAVVWGVTLTQPVWRLRSPRPPLRQLVREAGFVACVAAIVGYLVILDVQLVGGFVLPPWCRFTISVLLLWPVLGLPPWRSESHWIDRLGRAAGCGWIIVEAGGVASAYLLRL